MQSLAFRLSNYSQEVSFYCNYMEMIWKIKKPNIQSFLSDTLVIIASIFFDLPLEVMEEFRKEAWEVFKELIGSPEWIETGPIHYSRHEIYLFAIKPLNSGA
ncbi:hypothetical protein NPIL_52711 [Nephila pilipes]|uniref:Uncharacterized protein n=1 Tax=Nephila pilipes TaxID=299642 RepID=A0A8X6ILS4_NEPPI|nr:hypothetical protein NPIL_133681 [Nephila pilipes]GFS94263.1 hypothetical protein NPIL_52711 [Nephila pilipes]